MKKGVEVKSIREIVSQVAAFYGCTEKSIYQAQRVKGSQKQSAVVHEHR
jgi:hypothetical protein